MRFSGHRTWRDIVYGNHRKSFGEINEPPPHPPSAPAARFHWHLQPADFCWRCFYSASANKGEQPSLQNYLTEQ
jgi:hypothetical protein